MRLWKSLLASLLAISLFANNSAFASKGGIEQTGNKFVVGFTFKLNGVSNLCNGALVSPNVIATARHCVINRDGVLGKDYVFSEPGAKLDSAIDGSKVPSEIKQLVIPQQTPTTGIDFRLDIAFIVTNKPFVNGTPITFATPEEVAALNESSVIAGYGYGAVFETGAKYSSLPRKFDLTWKNSYLAEGTNSVYELLNESNTACKGDSGGPVTALLPQGREVLIGTISSAAEVAEGCGTKFSDGFYHLRVSLFHPYINQIPKPVVTPAPKVKKITCVKGTKKRVVTGVNPKCPKGFKLKK